VTQIRSVVLGCGSYLPEQVVTNAQLATRIDTSDEWIVQRTGIRERHIAAEGEFTSHLAIKAAQAALTDAGLDAQSIDLIVLATSTPDNTFPATAVAVQHGLRVRACNRRQFPAHRRLQARAGDRRRDLLAHPRLE
jgi:3-oxoacyl-[acyl-carrier-protein] synthase-3